MVATEPLPQLDPRYDCTGLVPGNWFVISTESNRENRVVEELEARGIPWYLPKRRLRILQGDRMRRVLRPLFDGYLFAAGSELERSEISRSRYVAGTIEERIQSRLRRELATIEIALYATSGKLGTPEPIPVGTQCEVTGGPMMGADVVIAKTGKKYLCVTMMNHAIEIEIDPMFLERA